MVPPFFEKDVETYFSHFERVATSLKWPNNMWTLMLQCVLIGKAQSTYASLPSDESWDYESVKRAILRAYELVPEAYRQRFRNCKKQETPMWILPVRRRSCLIGGVLLKR